MTRTNVVQVIAPAPSRRRGLLARASLAAAFAAVLIPLVANAQITSVKTVFVIVMSDQNWAGIKDNPNAPYINSLLSNAASADNYFSPPGAQVAVPNHLWLEAGTGFGISYDSTPAVGHQVTSSHLATLLMNAGLSWKTYQEGIDGRSCPVTSSGLYSTSDNPFVFFDDITSNASVCLGHVRPYTELAGDLASNSVARYNFIKPDLCHSMHQPCASISDSVRQGDLWLAQEVPNILASAAYQAGGALFITWDHGDAAHDGPIGMIVVSPYARKGYSNTIRYTHGSALRTFQQIFGLTNLLGDSAAQAALDDLFLPVGATNTASITLTWTPAPSATSYRVTRATSSQGPFSTIATGVANPTYTDRGLVSGTTYFYSVVAVNAAGESAATDPVTIKPVVVPAAPTNLLVKQSP